MTGDRTGKSRKGLAAAIAAIAVALPVLAIAVSAEAAWRDAKWNLRIPHIPVPRVVPHRAAPGGVRDPTIPAHRLQVVTPQRGPQARGCGPGVTRNAPQGGPGIFALPSCGRAVRGPPPNDPPGCARFGEVRICP
jgi:hypothetical protein